MHFDYVGPEEIRIRSLSAPAGTEVMSRDELVRWLAGSAADLGVEDRWATYVINLSGVLVLAPRRSEHVACAAGRPVLAAGEIRFDFDASVLEVTNNSTGYCPAEESWGPVCRALGALEIDHPGEFTFLARFRRCATCGERNLVKDEWYHCVLCDSELPVDWNFRT